MAQAQFATNCGGVVRVEDARDVFGGVLFFHRREVVAAVEVIEVEDVTGVCRPQAQGVRRCGAVAGDDLVVGKGGDLFAVVPDALFALVVDVATEADDVVFAWAADLPGDVLLRPGIRALNLFAVFDILAEHAVFVADAVAHRRDTQGGKAVHEAGGEASQTAVPQARIAFFGDDVVQILSQFGERFAQGVVNVFGDERVGQRPPHQEFHGEVIDAAQVFTAQIAGGLQPAFGGEIAHDEQGGIQPVGSGRIRWRTAEAENELIYQRFLQALHIATRCAVFVFLIMTEHEILSIG